MQFEVKNFSPQTIMLGSSLGIVFLIYLIVSGLYDINNRNQILQKAISNQFSVNSIIKELADISSYREELMKSILMQNDPFMIDELTQTYSLQASRFLKLREDLELLNLPEIQNDIFLSGMKKVGDVYKYQIETVDLAKKGKLAEAKILFAEKILPEKIKIKNAYNELISSMQDQSRIEIDKAQSISKNTMVLNIILLSIVFFISIVALLIGFRAVQRYNKLLIQSNEQLEIKVKDRTKELKLAKDDAEKANKHKSEFLSRVSHELRTPMNAILGYGQLLNFDKDTFSEQQSDNVTAILHAGNHLLTLINELLNLSKIESGTLEVSLEDVDLTKVLKQCILLIKPQADTHQVTIIDAVSEKDIIVYADFTRLKQIILNLLSNAVKYGNDNSKVIVDSQLIDDKRVRINVSDYSSGLSKDEIEKLFTSFTRLNKSKHIIGTGLGLAICKSLIELMGGSIGVDSVPGEGSTFWIELPLSKTEKIN